MTGDDLYGLLAVAIQKEIRLRHGQPVKDAGQDAVIRGIAEYLSCDYRYRDVSDVCSADEVDASFGILMSGQPGCGKTSVMRALRHIFSILGLRDPSAPSTEIREVCLPIYTAPDIVRAFTSDRDLFDRLCQKHVLAVDDVGTESMEVLVYGNIYSPVKELMYRRYNSRSFTMISTNLNGDEFFGKYGSRIEDRTREMFRVFRFPGKSFRG